MGLLSWSRLTSNEMSFGRDLPDPDEDVKRTVLGFLSCQNFPLEAGHVGEFDAAYSKKNLRPRANEASLLEECLYYLKHLIRARYSWRNARNNCRR